MHRKLFIMALLFCTALVILIGGCDKEKIVESTEYIRETEYVEVPGDTIFQVDTVYSTEPVTVYVTDTVTVTDTIVEETFLYDTVAQIEEHYDTTIVTDTVLETQYIPNEHQAMGALQYYSNPMVMELVGQELGLTDGWIFYLTTDQQDLVQQSTGVYDVYGLIDFWTVDWNGFYPIEYYWRLTYTGGDPGNPANWQMTDPPAVTGLEPGVNIAPADARAQSNLNR
jgi:hypothetical protein